ncbi:unnamed protein product [Chrysodeixis includens]|uniref:Uncharacterized protein n=1 Tax=Chrysodeixis includens TaxID=689277 RepID=A0A9P0FVR3_CHRIL|nr:unnamed protein product [Chrysodeixis includens]
MRKMKTRIIAVVMIMFLCVPSGAFSWFQSKPHAVQARSMASAVMDFLDYVFPKDDEESRMLKWLFMNYSDNEDPMGDFVDLMTDR